MDDTLTKLLGIYESVMETSIDENGFTQGDMIEKFHIDSLVALQIIVQIEKCFDYTFENDDEAIEVINSPTTFIKLFHRKLDENAY